MIARFRGRDLDPAEQKTIHDVETHGWHVINVQNEGEGLGWSYSIGLFANYNHPEVVIFGLTHTRRHQILNWMGDNIRRGVSFAANEVHDWVLDGYSCSSREVKSRWYKDLLGWARWFYAGNDFPCVQCIWPDVRGFYPWQQESGFFANQPLLYNADVASARMFHYVEDENADAGVWPFPCDPHTQVFVSRCVVEDGAPIVRVVHDEDGEWQFIGPVDDPEVDGCRLSCFHCVLERDASIGDLRQLAEGWRALRWGVADAWRSEPLATTG